MFKSKKKWILVMAACCLLISLVIGSLGCSTTEPVTPDKPTPKPEEPAKVYKLRYSHGLPPTHYMAEIQVRWAELVLEKSNGQVEIEVYPAAQLSSDRDLFEAVSTGNVEGGGFYTYMLKPNVAEWNGLAAFGSYWNNEMEVAVADGFVNQEGPAWTCAQATEGANMKLVAWLPWGLGGPMSGMAGTGEMPLSLSDMSGQKARSIGPAMEAVYSAFDIRPVYLSGAEVYIALQRGTIDVGLLGVPHMIQRKMTEVTDWYLGGIPFGEYQVTSVLINLDTYNELPPNLQQAILDAGAQAQQEIIEIGYDLNMVMLEQTKELIDTHILTDAEVEKWMNDSIEISKEFIIEYGDGAIQVYNDVCAMQEKLGLPNSPIE